MKVKIPQEEFNLYRNWLAYHLFKKDILITNCQRDIIAFILSLAKDISIVTIVEDIEKLLECGEGFAEFYGEKINNWESENDYIKQDYIDESGNNNYFTTEEQCNRVTAEYKERIKIFPEGHYYLDIPCRPLQAKHLKDIPNHADRVKALDECLKRIFENVGK